MTDYPHIFQPLTINGMTVRNRIMMPPMGPILLISMVLSIRTISNTMNSGLRVVLA